MSYALSLSLQKAVFAALDADATMQTLVGTAIFDAPPSGAMPALYVSLGPDVARDRSDQGVRGSRYDFTVSVVSDAGGFAEAKTVAAAISDVLAQPLGVLERGRIVTLGFLRARALRDEAGQQRRIDLTFRALLDDA